MSKQFGIRCDGLEEPLEKILVEHIKGKEEYIYMELGVATCLTFRAITDIIKENIKSNDWISIGVDILGSPDVNFDKINKIFTSDELIVNKEQGDNNTLDKLNTEKYHSVLVLRELATVRDWIKNIDDGVLDAVFIDGNHMKEQVILDFLAVENKVKQGGLVFHHDCGQEEVGTDYQGKDSNGNDCYIDVRGALIELGLLDNKRPGWKFITEIPGTRKTNNDKNGGNSLALFQRI